MSKGVFEKFKGTVTIDEKDITKSKVDVTIEMASINTNIAKRDDHLRSPDFFDVAKFPTMTFVSTKVEKAGADGLKVTGNLTIKGVTRQVMLNVEGPTAEIKSPHLAKQSAGLRQPQPSTARISESVGAKNLTAAAWS